MRNIGRDKMSLTEKERDLRVKELEKEIEELENRIKRDQSNVDSARQELKEREDAFLTLQRTANLRITELKLLIHYYKKNPNILLNPSERKNHHESKQKNK